MSHVSPFITPSGPCRQGRPDLRARAASADRAFTLIELLIVAAIFLILASLLCPVVLSSTRYAHSTTCQSNLHQIYLANQAYVESWDGDFAPIQVHWSVGGSYATTLDREAHEADQRADPQTLHNIYGPTVARGIFHCPSDDGVRLAQDVAQESGGGRLRNGHRREVPSKIGVPLWERMGESYRAAGELGIYRLAESDVQQPSAIFLAGDATGRWHTRYHRPMSDQNDDPDQGPSDADRWQVNVVFLDGHVKPVAFLPEIWNPYVQLISPYMAQ